MEKSTPTNLPTLTRPRRVRKAKRKTGRRPRLVRTRMPVNVVREALTDGRDKLTDNTLQPTFFRQYKDKSTLLSVLQQYHAHTRGEYLTALVHPDIAVKNGLTAKLPTDLPIPTSSIGFHTQNQFSTSALGTFLASWTPCAMVTKSLIDSVPGSNFGNFTYNNNVGLTGTATSGFNFFTVHGIYPAVELQRYRLVSAVIKFSYNGSVLNQAGTMLACATFDPLPVNWNLTGTLTTTGSPLVDRFGNFSIIQNGLWNRTVNITKDSEGIEALYVPMDPDDLMFQKANSYYGTPITLGMTQPDPEGAHVQYIFAGRNLPANSSCLIVDTYYNFEIIPDPTSAYIFKSAVDEAYTSKDKEELYTALKDVSRNGGLVRPLRSEASKWGPLLEKAIQMGIKYIPSILSMF